MTSEKNRILTAASDGDYKTLDILLQPTPTQRLQEANITIEKLAATAAEHGQAGTFDYAVRLGADADDVEVREAVIQGRSLDVWKVAVPAGLRLNHDYGLVGGPLSWVGNDVALAAYLLDHGADPNSEMQTGGYQPIALIARNPNDNPDMIELFLRHGAHIDKSGALLVAARHGNVEVARCLIAHGADVNLHHPKDAFIIRSGHSESALHWAVEGGHESLVALLLESSADMSLRDSNGATALDLAKKKENVKLIQRLEKHQSDDSSQKNRS